MSAHMASFVAGLLMVALCAYRLLCLCPAVRPHFCQFLRNWIRQMGCFKAKGDHYFMTHHYFTNLAAATGQILYV